ncbi:MAG: nickel-responsive transcriptional regulator NikR [Deltaproteobacteria bacterium]|jgi:CopG family nickel-responsive transcriptional regulator|nr:nickel-responsive transcriptional regulator NikR [Deltaproteobacteria bacterium]
MSNLIRCSLSIEPALFEKLNKLVEKEGYENRSEFIRDLIRNRLVEEEWHEDKDTLGTLTLVYDHETRNLNRNLTKLQHSNHKLFMATTHMHLDAHLCAEMIMLRGKASEIKEVANELSKQKGVLHSSLSTSSTGKNIK